MIRWLLPATILIPGLLGAVVFGGYQAGLYSVQVGYALGTLGTVIALSGLIWINAISLNRLDFIRHQTEKNLRANQEQLLSLIKEAPISIAMFDQEMRYLATSQRWVAEYGRGYSDLMGLSHYAVHPDVPERWKTAHRRGLAGETLKNDEDLWVLDDGTRFWLRWAIVPWHDAQGTMGGIIISAEDITERKQAEIALLETTHRFATLFEASPNAIVLIDPVQRWPILDCNSAACQMNGYSREELIGQSIDILNLTPGNENERITYLEQIRQAGVLNYETLHRRKNGEIFPVEVSTSLISLGGRDMVLGIDRDISERRQVEEALKWSESRYRALFEDVPVAIWEEDFSPAKQYIDSLKTQGVIDFHAYFTAHPEDVVKCAELIRLLDVNNAAVKMYEAESKAQLLLTTSQTISQGEQEHNHEDFLAIAEGKTSHTWEGMDETLTGKPIEISLSWSVAPNHEHDYSKVIVITTDITERKRAEEKLRLHEAVLQETGKIARVGGWSFEVQTGEGYWTEEVARIHDLDPADPTSREKGLSFYRAESRAQIETAIQNTIETATPYDLELELITALGNHKWVRTIGHPVVEKGKVVRIRGSFQDITENKKAAAALQQSEARLNGVIQSAMDAMISINSEQQIVLFNAAAEKMFGKSATEVLGQTLDQFIPARFRPNHKEHIRTFGQTGMTNRTMGALGVIEGRRANGEEFPIEASISQVEMANGKLYTVILRDVTERRQAEEEIHRLNAELEQRVASRTSELRTSLTKIETLFNIAHTAVTSENLTDALQEVVNQVALALPANRVTLLILDIPKEAVTHFIRGGVGQDNVFLTVSFEELMQGLTGWVIREGASALSPKGSPDVRESTTAQQQRAATNCGSIAVTPLRYMDQILGTITAINLPEERDFSTTDLELMEAAANQAAAVLVRAKLYENLQQTNRGLQIEINERSLLEQQIRQNEARAQALADLSQALAAADADLQALFETIASRITELLGDSCNLSLLSDDGKWLETKAVYHPDPEGMAFIRSMISNSPYSVDQGLTGRVARTGEPCLIPIVVPESVYPQIKPEFIPYIDQYGIASVLIVPIRSRDHILGTLGLSRDKPGNPYTPEDQAFLQDLADRVGLAFENRRLLREAQQAREEADRANLAKSEFLSRMSHELRTPLNAILGFGQLFGMDQLNAEQTENIGHILRAGKHLLGLINEVLDITRVETGNLSISPEPVRVKDLVEETLELVETMAARRDIHIQTSKLSLEYVQADRQRLKQILLNLLSNAIKYNRDAGEIRVDCQVAPGDRLRIRVSDTGPGLSEEKQARLFTPFDRLGAERSQVEGTGLGLSLSRRLAEAMGGKMGVESVLGRGSTFWVELPIVESPLEQSYHHHDGILQLNAQTELNLGYSVLCFEDNLSNLQLIEQIFKYRSGIKLFAAVDGEAGLEMARTQPPDLILLDLNLPDISGYEVLHRLKADPITQPIPVIIISADATPGQITRLMAAGADSYLTKPIDISQFLKILDEILDKR